MPDCCPSSLFGRCAHFVSAGRVVEPPELRATPNPCYRSSPTHCIYQPDAWPENGSCELLGVCLRAPFGAVTSSKTDGFEDRSLEDRAPHRRSCGWGYPGRFKRMDPRAALTPGCARQTASSADTKAHFVAACQRPGRRDHRGFSHRCSRLDGTSARAHMQSHCAFAGTTRPCLPSPKVPSLARDAMGV